MNHWDEKQLRDDVIAFAAIKKAKLTAIEAFLANTLVAVRSMLASEKKPLAEWTNEEIIDRIRRNYKESE